MRARVSDDSDPTELGLTVADLTKPEGWDGLTPLPEEWELRTFGFSDRISDRWYYSRRVGPGISLIINLSKAPLTTVGGIALHGYTEIVLDEDFGQPYYFGGLGDSIRQPLLKRINEELIPLREIGVLIELDPRAYGWEDWPPNAPLSGIEPGAVADELESITAAIAVLQQTPAAPPAEELAEESYWSFGSGIDPAILKEVAKAIDREAENFRWDSVSPGMTMGAYVAPAAIGAYLKALAKGKSAE